MNIMNKSRLLYFCYFERDYSIDASKQTYLLKLKTEQGSIRTGHYNRSMSTDMFGCMMWWRQYQFGQLFSPYKITR